ncbi:MAG: hypothetical protein IPO21_19710 [Bacteroidales bacterium]|nr:hypothetical protein [Bacteroidales bacterium]
MRKIKKELDVDFIGNQTETITQEEEKIISEYINSKKKKNPKKLLKSNMSV